MVNLVLAQYNSKGYCLPKLVEYSCSIMPMQFHNTLYQEYIIERRESVLLHYTLCNSCCMRSLTFRHHVVFQFTLVSTVCDRGVTHVWLPSWRTCTTARCYRVMKNHSYE